MMKLFGLKPAYQDINTSLPHNKHTRFENNHSRVQVENVDKPTAQPCQVDKVTPRRLVGLVETPKPAPAPRRTIPAPPKPAAATLAEQLHSDDQISVALLRRALPLRFADIDARIRETAHQSLTALQA